MTAQELRNGFLQLAMEGNLTDQKEEDGKAEELYKEIQKEKAKLIKEKKIKKEKPIPEISDDEIPFEIPENWKWVRLGFLTTYGEKKSKIKAEDITPNAWVLGLADIEKNTGKILNKSMGNQKEIKGEKVKFSKGDVLYSKLRPYLKKILVAPSDGYCSPEIVPFSSYCDVSPYFVSYFLKSPFVENLINSITYGAKIPSVSTDTMLKLVMPLPPLAEQKRIVEKLDQLLPLCEKLANIKERLTDPFYSEKNIKRLRRSIARMEASEHK